MNLEYVPLLPVMRELHSIPRDQPPDFHGKRRLRQYVRTISASTLGKKTVAGQPNTMRRWSFHRLCTATMRKLQKRRGPGSSL
jgi:hypothetical protein